MPGETKHGLSADAACSACHAPLEADGRCLVCLLGLGLDDDDPIRDEPSAAPADTAETYCDFEIARREDGSLWELGRGAMGVTYKAIDRVLRRPVALKVIQLGPDNADTGWRNAVLRERFLREARAAAALRHANVAGVLQFGASEEASRCFCAMDLVEGETLEARVRRDGPLDAHTTLDIARQVTAALVAAADRDLVHRDLKPGNLMLTAGASAARPEVKVIDFGLAKLAEADGPDPLHGCFAGTPAFASPEQLAGLPVDARSDLYSLGVTLWHTLTGRVPFTGQTLAELRDDPAHVRLPVEQLAARAVPACLTALLCRLLAPEPDKRPRSARELAEALEACRRELDSRHAPTPARHRVAIAAAACLAIGAAVVILLTLSRTATHQGIIPASGDGSAPDRPVAAEKSIAVLPFDNVGADQDSRFFTNGVQEEILADLTKISDLKVISRTSVMPYKSGAPRNLREIAAQLGVAHILEGSVQRAGNTVRVTAELIDASTDTHQWAMHYDRPLDDAFVIESEIAQAIADQVHAKISPEEYTALAQASTKDVLALQLYQQAKELKGHNSDPSSGSRLFQAVELLGQAVKRDARFLQAWCLLAEVQLDLYWEGFDHSDARREASRAAVGEAERFYPSAGETHLARAIYDYHGLSDYSRAQDELTLARRTLPGSVDVPFYAAAIYRRQGRWDEAVRAYEQAVELDPRNFAVLSEAAHTYEALERYPQAAQCYNRALAVIPADVYTRERLALIPYFEYADVQPLHALNASILAHEPASVEASAYFRLYAALAERDQDTARLTLMELPHRGFQATNVFLPPEWFAGLTARTFGDKAGASAAFSAARTKLEKIVHEQPDYAAAWSVLGQIDAALDRKEDAIREGQRGCELLPAARDAYSSPNMTSALAMIYAWTGERDLALQALAQVVHARTGISSGTRYGSLRLDPQWDPLRGDPRFESLVTSLAPKP